MSAGWEAATVLTMSHYSGFTIEGRYKRSHNNTRDIIRMAIVREEWDVQRDRKRQFA